MTTNSRESFFDRVFGPGTSAYWRELAAWHAQHIGWRIQWETQRAAWKAQRAAWKAQRHAERAAWRAQRRAWRWQYHPFGAVWGTLWTVAWIVFLAMIAFSPDFRHEFVNFVIQLPRLVVHFLQALVGKSEI
jgi:hypothetical protein